MSIKVVATNRRARREYSILERYEAGIALKGTEVKSIREGRVNIRDGYARVENDELFLYDVHISPYQQGGWTNHDPLRPRKLLMHKREIRRLWGKTQQRGFTLIPLRMYFKNGKVKVELGLARGKKLYDRREELKRKADQRYIERTVTRRHL